MFFALEECKNLLISYKDEMDFVKKKKPLEQIALDHAACTLGENSETEFIIHIDRRKIEFDAENERSAKKWFNALQHRRENIEMITSVRRKKAQPFEGIHFETTSSESDCDENNCAKENGTKQVTELATMKTKMMSGRSLKLISYVAAHIVKL
ncbi:unnamed protein product [Brugia pahangi]|uniref:PH domain-containing protein n=1 Tax=Brugia pahangi TaxID=6280 RepID=A0A0N4TVF2_BRUPA|nr:unnamed protein product [Brugia pahangi]